MRFVLFVFGEMVFHDALPVVVRLTLVQSDLLEGQRHFGLDLQDFLFNESRWK